MPTATSSRDDPSHATLHNFHADVGAFLPAGYVAGVTDATAAIQAAITSAVNAGGGIVFFAEGTYLISTTITVGANVSLVGAGIEAAAIKVTGNGQNVLTITGNSVRVRDLTINGNKASITGTSHGIAASGDSTIIERCRITSTRNNGIEHSGGDVLRVVNCNLASTDGSAIRIVASANDCLVQGNDISACHNGIFVYDNGTGASCNRTKIIGNTIASSTGTNPALAQDGGIAVNGGPFSVVEGNIIRSNTGRGIHVFGNSEGSVIVGNGVFDCGVTNQVSGIDVGDTGDTNFVVVGNQAWRCGAAGIFVAGLKRSIISGNMCVNNGQGSADAGNRNGITVNLTGTLKVEDCIFVGNHCFDSAGVKTQEYGIREWQGVAADYPDNIYIGNNCRTNKTGTMLLVSTSDFVARNKGFNPQGTATIVVDTSPFTYTNNDSVPEAIYIRSGTVSDIAKNARTIFVNTDQTVWLEPGEAVVVTYSVAPTMEKDRK